jgi:hypothetical protein
MRQQVPRRGRNKDLVFVPSSLKKWKMGVEMEVKRPRPGPHHTQAALTSQFV